jgi:uncharacterized protein
MMTLSLRAGLLAAALACTVPVAALADPHTITVTGQGQQSAVPDQANLSAGVATIARTADAALAANAQKMNAVFAALRNIGVPERAMQTSNFSVSPQYSNSDNSGQHITGYQVSNQVDVTLDDTKKLGPAIDALVGSGANQINSVSFGLRDNGPLMTKAREAAMADARQRAETLARAGGVSVGTVLSISEGSSEMPRPVMYRMAAMAAPASTPTAAGEQSVSVTVSVTYELK